MPQIKSLPPNTILDTLPPKTARKLLKEFEEAHRRFSLANYGHFPRNWESILKHAELKYGYWYWKGYKVSDLEKAIKK